MPTDVLTFDASSVRRIDENGNLHVATSPITRVQVAPYAGREIPESEAHGLEPNRIYQVYRPAEALADPEAVRSCIGIPVQLAHHPDYAAAPARDTRVGSTGDDCHFEAPFLMASLHIQDKRAIDLIKSGAMRELSLGYVYRPVFEAGETENGEHYDLKMADIRANHVALVEAGRAGSTVMVLDGAPAAGVDEAAPVADQQTIGDNVENETTEKAAAPEPTREEKIAKAVAFLEELGLEPADLVPPPPAEPEADAAPEEEKPAEKEAPAAPEAEPEAEAPAPAEEAPAAEEGPKPEPAEAPAPAEDEADEEVDKALAAAGLEDIEAPVKRMFAMGYKAALLKAAAEAREAEAADEQSPEEAAQAKLDAADECREEVGRVKLSAFDSANGIYQLALKQMGYTAEVPDGSARDVYLALKAGRASATRLATQATEPSVISRTLNRVRVIS